MILIKRKLCVILKKKIRPKEEEMQEIIWKPCGYTLSAPPPTNALVLLCFWERWGASSFLNDLIKAHVHKHVLEGEKEKKEVRKMWLRVGSLW